MRAAVIDRAVVCGFVVALAVSRTGTMSETDVFWQVRAGQDLLDGAALAAPDTWSWSPPSGTYIPSSPAWAMFVGLAWRVGGSWGLWLAASAYIVASLTVLLAASRWLGARWIPTSVALLAVVPVLWSLFTARSSIGAVAWLLLATWFGAWFAGHASRRPAFSGGLIVAAAGFAFSFGGNWWHASWAALAVLTAVAWTLSWLIVPELGWRRVVWFVVAGSAGLAAGQLAGPMGLAEWSRSRAVLQTCRDLVSEWQSAFSSDQALRYAVPTVLLILAAAAVVAIMARRWWSSRSLDPRDCLTLLLAGQAGAFALLGLVAVRFTSFAAFVLAPVLARALSHLMGRSDSRPDVPNRMRRAVVERTSDTYVRVIILMLMLVFIPLAAWKAMPHATPLSADAVAALPAGCQLFSTDVDANVVILLRPDVKVWIDGRQDMWGRGRLLEALERFKGRGEPRLLPDGTSCVLLSVVTPDDAAGTNGLAKALEESSEWSVLATIDDRIVWVPSTS
jgi:hypothetical protein